MPPWRRVVGEGSPAGSVLRRKHSNISDTEPLVVTLAEMPGAGPGPILKAPSMMGSCLWRLKLAATSESESELAPFL